MITPLKGTTSLNFLLIKTIILAAEKQKFTGFVPYYRHKKHTQKFCAKLQPCKTFLKLWSESFCTRAVAFLFESYYYHVCDNFKLVLWVQMNVYIILWPMFRSLVLLLSWWYCLGERVGEWAVRGLEHSTLLLHAYDVITMLICNQFAWWCVSPIFYRIFRSLSDP